MGSQPPSTSADLQPSDSSAPPTVDSARLAALQLVTGAIVPGAVAALVRLNVFETLAKSSTPLTPEEIASRAMPNTPISIPYLSRLLRMMSGQQILRETVTESAESTESAIRRYSPEPIARYLIDDPENGSFKDHLLSLQHPSTSKTYQFLRESVLDDSENAFEKAHNGLSKWEYAKQNPEYGSMFNKAMAGDSMMYLLAVLEQYKGFEDVKVLVDVGGGFGSSLARITAKYPNMRGVNFDQPHVVKACPPIPRVEHVGGDMFVSVPQNGDAILMKYILHDWNDEQCLKILKKCKEALPADGKVIAMDNMVPDIIDLRGADHVALRLDILMMVFCARGARERTESELRKLGLAAGFREVQVVCRVDAIAVTEFRK